jgi:hypothetical protein
VRHKATPKFAQENTHDNMELVFFFLSVREEKKKKEKYGPVLDLHSNFTHIFKPQRKVGTPRELNDAFQEL